ncbi:MAG TPA: hypothetical protein VNG90_04835, partial [Candidatus Acidoferrum sp.]|nr:hypothetical protein [Candidatus Acidoferrum sp.]
MIVAFAQLNSLLEVNPLALANSSDPVFMLWDGMRNIANVALVGIFFFVIISQATSIGISNYGIKRMLPRLLSAAIFANLSFYVMAFIIDSFNLFGAGVGQLVIGVLQNTGLKGGDVEWTSVFGVSVLGLSAVGVLARGALPFLFGLLVIVALLVLATVIVLLLRQMVILVLVVFAAPLAVARALDGTRSLYDKAETLFIRLMIMYPVIVLVFASGKIVGLVLSAEFTLTTGSPAAQGVAKAVRLVLATLSAGLPLAILPFIFRATGGWTQKIYNGARNIGQTTERLRLGLAANLGTKTLGSEAWAAAHPRLSTIHQTPLDIISGNRLVRSRTAREAAYKTNLERHNALMSASGVMGRLTGNDVARVKGIKAVAAARAKDLEVAQTVFRHNVLAPAGVGDYDLLDGLTTYLRSPTPGNALVRGSKGQVDLRQYVGRRDFQQAAASMAGEYGEIGALMAMRARSPRGAQQNVTDAINAHSKTVGDSGGVFLQDPAYADRARARRSVANSYPDGSDGADAAGRADLQSLLDVKLLEEMVKRSPNRLVKSSSSYQEAVRDALLRAGNPSDPGYDQQLDEMLIQALGAPGGNGKGQVFTRSLLSALTSRDIAPESPNAALTNEILAILQSRYGGAPSGGTNPNLSPNAGPGGSPSPAGNGGGNNGPGGNAGAGPARGSKLYSPHEAAAQIAGLGLAVVSAQGVAGRLGIQTDQAQALVQDLLDRGFLEAAPGGGNFHQVAAGFDINNLPISVPPHEAGNRAAYQTMAGRREQAIQDLVAGTQSEDEIRGQIYQAAKQAAKTAGANPLQAVAAAIGATNAGMLAINQRVVLQQRAASTDLVDVQARAAAASAYAAAVAAGNVDPRERARQAAFDIYRKAGDSARGPKAEQMASAVSGAVPSGAPAPATPNTGQPSAVPPVPAAPQPILQRVPRPSSEDQYQIARQNTLRDGALSVSGIQRALRVSQSRAREIAREIIRREPERFAPGTQLVETPRTITQQGDQPIFKIEGDRSIPIIASRQEQDEARDAISKQRAAAGKANREASAANQVIIDQVVREVARRVFGSQPSGADEAAIEAALSGYDAALADNKLQEARRLASAAAEFSYGEDKVVAAGRDERIADALVNLYAARAAALPPPPPPVPAPQPAPEAQAVPNAAPAVAEPPRLVAQPPLTDEQRFIQQAEKEIKRLGLQKLSATGLAASLGLLPNGEN